MNDNDETMRMLPSRFVLVDSKIPDEATFWTPKPSDIGDEGFDFFRGTWPIVGATVAETKDVLESERRALLYMESVAKNEAQFEVEAAKIEALDVDASSDEETALSQALGIGWSGLLGLELGVAGLVYTLSHCGFYPAASCRSHLTATWSQYPVVLIAADRVRVEKLGIFLDGAGCGLEVPAAHPNLIAIYAPSIAQLNLLANEIFAVRSIFRTLPKTERRMSPRKSRSSSYEPEPLF
jgi:hypothetical protein